MKTLKYAVRFLLRAKSYTTINLLGLTLSLACCIILSRYIYRETTVDMHCIDRNQVYGVQVSFDGNRVLSKAEIGKRDSTYIDDNVILTRSSVILLENDYVDYQTNRFSVHALIADNAYFRLFPYQVLQGEISLEAPESALLMEDFAKKLFGKENPLGKVLRFSNGKDIKVTGILKKPVNKQTFNFDIVLSHAFSTDWGRMPLEFIQFTSEKAVEQANQIGSYPRFINQDSRFGDVRKYTFSLIPVSQMYWEQALLYQTGPSMLVSGNRSHLFILGGICLLILFAGIINFINLYSVLMVKRGRTYNLRKVFGASGNTLFTQIFTENVLLIAVSIVFAWFIVEITSVFVSHLLDIRIVYTKFDWILSISIMIFLSLTVSLYSHIKCQHSLPAVALKALSTDKRSIRFRMIFLFVQYVVTFLLVLLSIYFNKQFNLMLQTDPGFRTKDIIQANMIYESNDYSSYTSETVNQRKERVLAIDQLIDNCPDIQSWTTGFYSILGFDYSAGFRNAKGELVTLNQSYVTDSFFKLFEIPFIEGDLSEADKEQGGEIIVVNRAALATLGYTSCKGATIINEQMRKIKPDLQAQPIGAVIEDYYDRHVGLGARPMVFIVNKRLKGDYYQIACYPGKTQVVINYLKDIQKKVYGTEDFKYSLLDDDVAALYKNDRRIAMVYAIFACIGIIIICLGLFGISLFDIRQRYREIAIRKVNGALVKDLYLLLGCKYLVVLGSAFAVSIPLSCYLIYQYTKALVIKAPLSMNVFLIALLVVSCISLGTLCWQIKKASRIDPAKIMKIE